MICPKCNIEMDAGKAINPKYDPRAIYIAPVGNLSADEVELIDCLKCPQCGFSDASIEQYENGKNVMGYKGQAELDCQPFMSPFLPLDED